MKNRIKRIFLKIITHNKIGQTTTHTTPTQKKNSQTTTQTTPERRKQRHAHTIIGTL